MKPLFLSLVFLPLFASSEDYPRDVEEILFKLEVFEEEELKKANQAIREKRIEVVRFLEAALDRETKSGNLDKAVALKNKIDELKELNQQSNPGSQSTTSSEQSGDPDFEAWLATVEFHDASGQWEITPDEVIQHSNKGISKTFKREGKSQARTISFEASGTLFHFEVDPGRKKGVRKSDKFSPIPFTVEPRRKR